VCTARDILVDPSGPMSISSFPSMAVFGLAYRDMLSNFGSRSARKAMSKSRVSRGARPQKSRAADTDFSGPADKPSQAGGPIVTWPIADYCIAAGPLSARGDSVLCRGIFARPRDAKKGGRAEGGKEAW
jgi:hypothetical protein